jgi:hypothetical protein
MKTETKNMNIKQFTLGYIECALWSSVDDDGEPLDSNQDGADALAPETLARIEQDCAAFIAANKSDLAKYAERWPLAQSEYTASDCAGHDFWLTRVGHGAGFWDRGFGELGERLTDSSEKFGGLDLYVGDDGKLYLTSA